MLVFQAGEGSKARKQRFDATIVIRAAGTNHSTLTSSSGSDDGTATFTMPCHSRMELGGTTGASWIWGLARMHRLARCDAFKLLRIRALWHCYYFMFISLWLEAFCLSKGMEN